MSDAFAKFRARVSELQSQGTARPMLVVAPKETHHRPPEVAARPGLLVLQAKPPEAVGQASLRPGPAAPFSLPSKGGAPSVTLSQKRMRAEAKLEAKKLGPKEPPVTPARPKTRGDCFGGPRPCPFVSCKYHTYLDVTPKGSLVINRPDVDVVELKASCSLDIADAGGATLDQVGAVLNVTRERARQIQASAVVHAEKAFVAGEVRQFRGSCKAVCALSGRRCQLPAHEDKVQHRNERGAFHLVALPDQTHFPEKERLERAASQQRDEGLFHAR